MSNDLGVAGATFMGCMCATGLHDGRPAEGCLDKKKVVLLNIGQILSWIPGLSAIVMGVVRISIGAKLIHSNRSQTNNCEKINVSMGAWSVVRGSVEVLTLGLIAPINMIADIAVSLLVVFAPKKT